MIYFFFINKQRRNIFLRCFFSDIKDGNCVCNILFKSLSAVGVHLGAVLIAMSETASAINAAANAGHSLDKITVALTL